MKGYANAMGHSALPPTPRWEDAGLEMMVYGSTHAPGEPMTWVRRITGSGERLVDLGRRAVRLDEAHAKAASSPMRFFLGPPTQVGNVVLVPMRWDVLSCCLIGEFRLAPSFPSGTQISLRATYDGNGSPDDARRVAVERTAQALVDGIPSTFGLALPVGGAAPAPMRRPSGARWGTQ
jgi:hypothetical protein